MKSSVTAKAHGCRYGALFGAFELCFVLFLNCFLFILVYNVFFKIVFFVCCFTLLLHCFTLFGMCFCAENDMDLIAVRRGVRRRSLRE